MSVDTVISASASANEQREKQGGDSAFGGSQSPEKQSKDAAKKPASPTRPYSFPPAGDNAKDESASGPSVKTSKPRPHSYPAARSKCSSKQSASGATTLQDATATAVEPAAADLESMPTECREVYHFCCPLRDRTHDVAIVAQFTQL